jgi:modulator of FtsH protease
MSLTQFNVSKIQDRSEFVSKVYTMLGLSLLFCCAGAYFGLSMPPSLYWPMIIAEFALLLACMFLQKSYPLNIMLLFGFTTVSGITLGPVLNSYIAHGMGDLIPIATGATAITFGGLSAYVHISKKDFSFLGGALFVGLIGMVLVGFAGFFFHLPISNTLYSGFGVLLFSGFILYDTSNLVNRYQDDQYVAATLGLYLDILNLFLFILRLLSDRRR